MDLLHATLEEFAADGYTHVECFYPRCRVIRMRPMSWLPRIGARPSPQTADKVRKGCHPTIELLAAD
jgi:hypothetical protein